MSFSKTNQCRFNFIDAFKNAKFTFHTPRKEDKDDICFLIKIHFYAKFQTEIRNSVFVVLLRGTTAFLLKHAVKMQYLDNHRLAARTFFRVFIDH